MASATTQRAGAFVTLEGIDGCGKSTQVKRLVRRLAQNGVDAVAMREPGGAAICEKVRALLLDPANDEMCDACELLLYEASRAQLVGQVIEPALRAGTTVVCDRFYDSTTAYQAHGRGIDLSQVETANALGSCGVIPDLTLVFDLDVEVAFSRATQGGADRLESEGAAFQRRVRDGYLDVARRDPNRVRIIDATGTPDEVEARVWEVVREVVCPESAS